jgi:hypothetical protein
VANAFEVVFLFFCAYFWLSPHPIEIGRLCDTHETRTFALAIKAGEKGIGREDKIKGTVIESILHSNYVAS